VKHLAVILSSALASRALASRALASCALASCAPALTSLPPAPPAQSATELAAWQQVPALQPEPELQLGLAAQRTQLPGGLGVTVVPRPETSGTALYLHVPGAADRSTGDVAVMAEALRAGTRYGKESEILINPQLGPQPIRIATDAAGTTFSWQVLPRVTQTAVSLLAAFVLRPAFDPSEVQIRLQQRLSDIQRESVDLVLHTQRLARAAIPTLSTPTHEDDARGLFQLTPARLKQIHACTIAPTGAELVIVGPVAADAAMAWAKAAFGAWTAPAPAAGCQKWRSPARAAAPEQSRLARAELRMILNSAGDPYLFIDVPGPALDSPDYPAFVLLSKVLQNRRSGAAWDLRHAGGSYGIQTRVFEGYPHLTLLEVEGQVDEATVEPALRSLIADLRSLADDLKEQELDAAKRRSRSELLDTLSYNALVARLVLRQLRRGQRAERLHEAATELSRVDVERCREVARRWLSSAEPSMAVTGRVERGLGIPVSSKQMAWTDQLQSHKKAP
jgi:predicted Zn-dependent peptidase